MTDSIVFGFDVGRLMVPIVHNQRVVGWLPPVMEDPRTQSVVAGFKKAELAIVQRDTDGRPQMLRADSLRGLCALPGFLPEDAALKAMKAADA